MDTSRRAVDPEAIEDLVARLERERGEADRLYNAALTAVDRAIQTVPQLPNAPPGYDSSRLVDLNALWNILPGDIPASNTSLKGRLRRFVWRLIGPSLETQARFNATVADHINRNVAFHEQGARGVAAVLDAVREELAALVRFQSLLVQYLQTITVYVDSKDRSLGGSEDRKSVV